MKIFVTGASGYIGGSVGASLARRGHTLRGLIRNAARADELRAFGMEPVVGTLDDSVLLMEEARNADAVINAASSDHRGAVEALLLGLAGSEKPFLHTSGSSLVGDEALGEPSDAIFTEETPVDPAPDKIARIAIDTLIRDAAPGVRTVVLCNTMIYGNHLGPVSQSVQIPPLVAQAKESGIARHIGRGLNRWSNVHIADVAELYALALEKAPAGSFYFVENGEASFKDITDAIGKALDIGASQDWSPQDAIARWGRELAVFGLSSNSRVRADKARAELGWAPVHRSVTAWIEEEMQR
ncbi:NAD-dependent epimerase/dehydratase [Gluconacetobacter diazotrophicus PA1 5]|uniref:NAD-dependent epimerase/dehydratase family protein n=1 Tax=Gluconacetobacter diazotrophicus TaxID=33996 RepID=UPI000173B5C5|nr:NAD-dependent epimerase/dehydratase family protein [Gluconacetobacter diazotrophicus]ACI52631.1 NAD-dependent epimerase/dehydratase [Gluconacetobacter diazotrophicus PA1 5]TWB06038.1 nucleoside-diphosphate-sugar epimerase [Gluconacetobacter diazotrophicus]